MPNNDRRRGHARPIVIPEETAGGCGCGCGSAPVQADFCEDMPMSRYVNPIPISCGCGCATASHCGCNSGRCDCQEQLEQVTAALAYQNQLLIDLLGAVNSLTATLLSDRASGGGTCCGS